LPPISARRRRRGDESSEQNQRRKKAERGKFKLRRASRLRRFSKAVKAQLLALRRLQLTLSVMAGLDPAIHHLRKRSCED